MPFNSYEFILGFLPVALAGYWLLARFAGRTAALGWLLLTSVAFYAHASLASLAIIIPSILIDYLIALALLRVHPSRERLRTLLFTAAVAANIAFLGYFKYKNFFLDTANAVFATHFELTSLILPLGVSFITFQKIAFLADVKSGQVKTVRFFDFLLFTLFFPRVVAGPIVHFEEVMPQLADTKPRDIMTNVAVGVCLFSIGLFKKAVIADGIAPSVLLAFDTPFSEPPTLLLAWKGVLAYTFQLYFDFSAYSDMALGVARMVGVRLPMNFDSPLKASSIVEFWSRWHVTLTRFLTAYIYTPIVLRMTRVRMAKGQSVLRGKRSRLSAIAALVAVPTLITMTISGFWHGAGWQFIVWGVLHGVYLTTNQCWRILRPRFWPDQASYERLMKPLGFALTFVAVVIAFVFFRASSVSSALSILGSMAGMNGGATVTWGTLWPLVVWFKGIIILFLAVTLLPNSLELLRRFQPALDFPEQLQEAQRETQAVPSVAGQRPTGAKAPSVVEKLCSTWRVLGMLGKAGISLSRLTATITALLCVLGLMALNRGGTFLYWQF